MEGFALLCCVSGAAAWLPLGIYTVQFLLLFFSNSEIFRSLGSFLRLLWYCVSHSKVVGLVFVGTILRGILDF